jgi:hypothetical protein
MSKCSFNSKLNHIGGVIASVFASNVVDSGFEPRSGQTKDFKINNYCYSAKHAALRS